MTQPTPAAQLLPPHQDNSNPPVPLNHIWIALGVISALSALFLAFGIPCMGAIAIINPPLWLYGVLCIPALVIGGFSLWAFKKV
jgi:hypothetical protein